MKIQSVKINAILNIIYTLSNIIFPLMTFPYASRVLLVDNIGKVSFFTAVSNYAIMIASLGITTYGIRATAKVRDNKKELSKTVEELFLINFCTTAFVIVSLVLATPLISKFSENIALLTVNIVLILSTPFGLNWLFSGLEQYTYITVRAIIVKSISLVAIFVLVKDAEDYVIYAAIVALSSILSYVLNFWYAKKFVTFVPLKMLRFMPHLKPMFMLFASILAINVYTNLDTAMLGFISGDAQVGLYTVAVYVKTALLTMVNAISHVLLPRLSYYYSGHNQKALNELLKKSIIIIFSISLPLTVFFVFTAQECVQILGGDGYEGAVPCMQIIMPILLISGFSNIVGNQILIPQGKDSCFLKAVAIGAIIDLIFNSLLMPRYGCIGAAIATLIAESVQMLIQFYFAREEVLKNITPKSTLKIILAVTIASCALTFSKKININPLVDIVIYIVIFFTIYLAVILMEREPIIMGLVQNTLHRREKNEERNMF